MIFTCDLEEHSVTGEGMGWPLGPLSFQVLKNSFQDKFSFCLKWGTLVGESFFLKNNLCCTELTEFL